MKLLALSNENIIHLNKLGFCTKDINRYLNRGGYAIVSLLGIYKTFPFLLLQKEEIIGCIVVRRKIDKRTLKSGYWLYDVLIKSEYRGLGYGKKMMLLIFDYLREKQVKTVRLVVSKNNSIAFNLYTSMGFVVESSMVDDYIMIRNL